jgi:uncharacterized membrane protein (DUF485 family)
VLINGVRGYPTAENRGSIAPTTQSVIEGGRMTTTEADEVRDLRAVAENPKYKELIAKRTRFGWMLTAIMLVVYYGYVSLIAFDKAFLARPIGTGVMSLGIPIGFGVIVISIILTGVYVVRANGEFDRLTREIVEEAGQ